MLRQWSTFFAGMLFALLLWEGVLRMLPVASDVAEQPTREDSPVLFGQPGLRVRFSRGWRFQQSNETVLNNLGLRGSDIVHRTGSVAVVGDSYIEAPMLEPTQTLPGRLQTRLPERAVFGIGVPGASLSDYLVYARWARREYNAATVVVNLVTNDVLESLLVRPGMTHIALDRDPPQLIHDAFAGPNAINHRILGASALARYLKLNLLAFKRFRFGSARPVVTAAATCLGSGAESRTTKLLLDGFEALRRDGARVVFVVDPERGFESVGGSSCQRDIDRFADRAGEAGFEVVRLDAAFARALAVGVHLDGRPLDGHWSGAAHDLAAQIIAVRLRQKSTWNNP